VVSTTYDATFDVIVETGNEGERETISHTLRCTDPVPPEPPEPLKPYLTGPEMVRGEWQKGGHWWWPTYRLTCSDFDLELVSPDGGPWALVPNGELEIKYLNWARPGSSGSTIRSTGGRRRSTSESATGT
jgi:hypothetical protein